MSDDEGTGGGLFNEALGSHYYDSATYHSHLIEQYKLYVEMADRISMRRQAANAFFVSINTALLALSGYVKVAPDAGQLAPVSPVVPFAGALLCILWASLIMSYRNLNTIKFEVIHGLERRLPARLYAHEWDLAEHGKNSDRYLPVTHVEVWVPWVFMVFHGFVFFALRGAS